MKKKTTILIIVLSFFLTLKSFGQSISTLSVAVINQDFQAVKVAIEKNEDVNERFIGFTPLMWAAFSGNSDIAKLLIENKAEINTRSTFGRAESGENLEKNFDLELEVLVKQVAGFSNKGFTPLMCAVQKEHTNIVNLLLGYGANVNESDLSGNSILGIATDLGNYELCEILIGKGADINFNDHEGNTALMKASYIGHDKIINLLLSKNVYINAQKKDGKTALFYAVQKNHLSTANLLIKNEANINIKTKKGASALIYSISAGYEDMTRLLILNKANINIHDNNSTTPLMFAINSDKINLVRLLLENGAKVDAKAFKAKNQTALMVAIQLGKIEIVKLLLKFGADVNIFDDDKITPFIYAIRSKNIYLTNLLIDHGADVNAQLENGWTALMLASYVSNIELVNFLIKNGAKVNIKNDQGKTAIDFAQNQQLREILEQNNADNIVVPSWHEDTVTDYDGNVYKTIKIGKQIWMAENLKVTHYRNGDPITNVTSNSEWTDLSTGAFCVYDNNLKNADIYGFLYNWYAVGDNRNIAPVGWHVPSNEEWQTLVDYLGGSGVAGDKMIETGTAHWKAPNTRATNESGLSALPSGNRNLIGKYSDMGRHATFWSSSEDNSNYAWYSDLNIYTGYADVRRLIFHKRIGFSVRCVKD